MLEQWSLPTGPTRSTLWSRGRDRVASRSKPRSRASRSHVPRNGSHIWGITILRVTLGLIFVVHGAHKLFVIGPAGVQSLMAAAGLPLPGIFGLGVATLELGGGICLLLGLFVRPVALVFAMEMAVATVTIHLPYGFFAAAGDQGGYEYPLALAGASTALALIADPNTR